MTCYTSKVTCDTSNVTCYTSKVTCDTSNVTCSFIAITQQVVVMIYEPITTSTSQRQRFLISGGSPSLSLLLPIFQVQLCRSWRKALTPSSWPLTTPAAWWSLQTTRRAPDTPTRRPRGTISSSATMQRTLQSDMLKTSAWVLHCLDKKKSCRIFHYAGVSTIVNFIHSTEKKKPLQWQTLS